MLLLLMLEGRMSNGWISEVWTVELFFFFLVSEIYKSFPYIK